MLGPGAPLGLRLQVSESIGKPLVECLLERSPKQPGDEPLVGLLRVNERRAVSRLETVDVLRLDAEGLPVQPISLGASTRWIVDVMVPGPAFQRNTDPAARSPCTDIDFTSGFQFGHFSRSVSTSQTACELAAISISAALTTGAFLLTSKAVNNL